MASGNPASTALLPTEIKAAHQPSGKAKPETNLRFGEAIMMPSFEINEVTVRTVKRIPQKEALQRGGWKAPAYNRRGSHTCERSSIMTSGKENMDIFCRKQLDKILKKLCKKYSLA